MKLKNKGLGLLEVLMSLSILTIAIMAVLGLKVSFIQSGSSIYSDLDYLQLTKEFSQLVGTRKNCTATLQGLNFRASEIRDIDSGLQLTELWLGSNALPDPAKITKKIAIESKYGKIKITQIALYLPSYNGGNDLTPYLNLSYGQETPIPAEIALAGEYQDENGNRIKIPIIKETIYLIISPTPPDTNIKYCISMGDF